MELCRVCEKHEAFYYFELTTPNASNYLWCNTCLNMYFKHDSIVWPHMKPLNKNTNPEPPKPTKEPSWFDLIPE